MQSLAWALLHFLWQGTALAAAGGSRDGAFAPGIGSLSDRVARRWSLMLAAPIATILLLRRNEIPVRLNRFRRRVAATAGPGERQALATLRLAPSSRLRRQPPLSPGSSKHGCSESLSSVFARLEDFCSSNAQRRRQSTVVEDQIARDLPRPARPARNRSRH